MKVIREVQAGDALGLTAAANLFPAHRGSGRLNPSTVHRWIHTGAESATGKTVRLEACRVGGRWVTSAAAVTRFMEALTDLPAEPEPEPPVVR